MIPFDQIYENEDRSWSMRLVQHLAAAPGEKDLWELSEVLEHLADPQTVQPLMDVLLNSTLPVNVRDNCSAVHFIVRITCNFLY